ncbi:MAG TPA: 3'(2'),5'-bisphosphate nucleotidase CysQ [Terriglobales bacterium]|nr:3'(2'),5'-bisphosphate nucleotidase CysQ [Terriglobales bacterium]
MIVPERNSAQDFEHNEPLRRIQSALDASREVFVRFSPGKIEAEYKARRNLVTEADRAIDALLRQHLLREGEGWLSEESADDRSRLGKARVWVVDPLDGTLEFVAGIPEFCTSVALVDNGYPVAGGIYNPATNQFFLGSLGTGVTLNGAPVAASRKDHLQGALILGSRSETKRGEWKRFEHAPFRMQPTGSVAYKLALVAAGMADAMFTLRPKHEWDIAAGVALVEAAAGFVGAPDGAPLSFNRPLPRLPGLLACGMSLRDELLSLINTSRPVRARRP